MGYLWLISPRRHVVNDLDAYVCLFEDCDCPEILYSHSSKWLDHMREHALRWRCTSKSHGGFLGKSRDDYIAHIKTVHGSRLTDAQLRVLADKSARTMGQMFKSCPLCGTQETRGSMEAHIVGHLRLLALRSLPVYDDGGTGIPDDDNTESEAPRSRSTIQDFMETPSHADDNSWGTPSAAGAFDGDGASFMIHRTTDEGRPVEASAADLPDSIASSGNPGSAVKTVTINLDPNCAICNLPASAACYCETRALEDATRQAEARMMQGVYNEIKVWIRTHAQTVINDRFRAAVDEACKSHGQAKHVGVESGASEPSTTIPRAQLNELWSEAVETYPAVLQYFYSLVEFQLPADDEPAVREPPLSALRGSRSPRPGGRIKDDLQELSARHNNSRATPAQPLGDQTYIAAGQKNAVSREEEDISGDRSHHSDLKTQDSDDWLLEDPSFKAGRDAAPSNVSWFNGNPAVGKSVLLAHMENPGSLPEDSTSAEAYDTTPTSGIPGPPHP